MIPKFRAWYKGINELYYDVRVTSTEEYEKVEVLDCFTDWIEIEDNDHVLMRNTGLKDKKGNEIYEGDICAYYYGDVAEYCEVKWSEKYSTWMIEGDSDIEFLRDFAKHSVFEVVGNIYEDPELLEEAEE